MPDDSQRGSENKMRTSATLSPLDMLPVLDDEQKAAIREKRPIPPSPEWLDEYERARQPRFDSPAAGDAPSPQACSEAQPIVYAVLCVGDNTRMKLARSAVNAFTHHQNYPNRRLIIVNGTPDYSPVISDPTHPNVLDGMLTEISTAGKKGANTLGGMRNIGLAWARENCEGAPARFLLWDDDDKSSVHRISCQVGLSRPGFALLLPTQIRIDVNRSIAYLHLETGGIAATGLYPLTDADFPPLNIGEDRSFWLNHWSHRTDVAAVGDHLDYELSVAVYHDRNALPLERFMVDHHAPEMHNRWMLPEHLREHLKMVMGRTGFRIEEQPVPAS